MHKFYVEQTCIMERMVFPSLLCISEARSAHLGWRREKPQTDAANAFSWKCLIHLVCWPWKSSSQVHQDFPTVSKAACRGFIAGASLIQSHRGQQYPTGVTLEVTDNQTKTTRRWLWPTAAEWKLRRILKLSNLNGSAAASPPHVSLFADCLTFLSREMAPRAATEQKKLETCHRCTSYFASVCQSFAAAQVRLLLWGEFSN